MSFAGVWLLLSTKYIVKILANFVLWIHLRRHRVQTAQSSDESTHLLGRHTGNLAQSLAKVLKETSGVRDLFSELLFDKGLTPINWVWLFLFYILVAVISLTMIFVSVYSARVKFDGAAMLKSDYYGLWLFNKISVGEDAATRTRTHDLEKETRTAGYAQNCYGTPDKFDAARCDLLYQQKLEYSDPEWTTDCQFQSEICLMNKTIHFKNTVDGSEIGINSPATPKFHRTTNRSALNMEYPFVQNVTENGTTNYYYYYGEKPDHDPPANYTYKTDGDPFDGPSATYSVL